MAIEGYVAPRLAVERLGPYLRHVHVKNVAWAQQARAWRWRYAALADGLVDWPSTMAALAAAGYGGWFSIDHLGGRPTQGLLGSETDHLRRLVARTP
jgi:sugar phosphate isomerase/epimerase